MDRSIPQTLPLDKPQQQELWTLLSEPKHLGYAKNFNAGFFVYRIINHMNGMQYIGCTKYALLKRWQGHLASMNDKRDAWKPLYRDMLNYGIEQFTMELIVECSSQFSMRQQETRIIYRENTIWPNGYNLHPGRIRDIIGKP